MKTLITVIVTAVLTFVTYTLSANNLANPLKFAKVETIIDHYIDATVNGETTLLKFLFTDDFTQSTPNNGEVDKVSKAQVVKHLKSLKGIQTNCETSYEFVEKNSDCSIVKVTKRFANFQRVDYVTMCNTDAGWKINKVLVAYPER